jgi:hypothetical protein
VATNFIEMTLTRADGQPISNITHMEFGPDGLDQPPLSGPGGMLV